MAFLSTLEIEYADEDNEDLENGSESDSDEDKIGDNVLLAHQLDDPLSVVESCRTFTCKDGLTAQLSHFTAQCLAPTLLHWILDLMDRNMKEMYEKSQDGWDPEEKKEEMTSSNSRYLIAFINEKPVAFSHFMFDMDYGRQVVYCYEIQLEPSVRSAGLGKFIMGTLEMIASEISLPMVVLTVFKHNSNARLFFSKIGYKIDETNPSKKEGRDYFILSKTVCTLPS